MSKCCAAIGEQTVKYDNVSSMGNIRLCHVSFEDSEGTTHAAEISAESVFEAAALALQMFDKAGLVACRPGPATHLEIRVTEPVVTHRVTVQKVRDWLGTNGKTPREQALKHRLRGRLAPR